MTPAPIRRSTRRVVAAVTTAALAVLGAGLLAAPAQAAGATVTAAPSSVPAGTAITLDGAGFVAGQVVQAVKLDGAAIIGGGGAGSAPFATADDAGAFSAAVTVPAGTAPGAHTLNLLGSSPNKVSEAVSVTVVADEPAGPTDPSDPDDPDEPTGPVAVTCTSDEVTVASGSATACVQRDVATTGGATIALRGSGWTTTAGAGSTVVLKLTSRATPSADDFQLVHTGAAGDAILTRPSDGAPDATIWAVVKADADGAFALTVPLPTAANVPATVGAGGALAAGHKLVVRFQSGSVSGDTVRSVESAALVVDGTAYAGDRHEGSVVACTAGGPATAHVAYPNGQAENATTGPVLDFGDTIHLVGTGWCSADPAAGGSVIGVKLDEGSYVHRADELVAANASIWAIVTVNSADGSFDATITLPTQGSGPGASTPAFASGAHSLRLLTGSLKSGDVARSVETGTFTVGTYQPNGLPDLVEANEDLTAATQHGATATRGASELAVRLPGAGLGAWAFLTAYLPDGSVRYPWAATWFRADAAGVVHAPLAGVTLPTGTWRLAVQAPDGSLLGWASVTVPQPATTGTPPTTGSPGTSSGSGGSNGSTGSTATTSTGATSTRTTPGSTGATTSTGATRAAAPTSVPAPPFADADALLAADTGGVTAGQDGTIVTLTLPAGVTPGSWVYLYVYSQPVPVGWVQVDANRQVRVDLGLTAPGEHHVAVLDADGALVGWAAATVPGDAAQPAPEATAEAANGSGDAAPAGGDAVAAGAAPQADAAAGGSGSANAWLVGVAGALLVVGAVVVVAVRRRRAGEGSAR